MFGMINNKFPQKQAEEIFHRLVMTINSELFAELFTVILHYQPFIGSAWSPEFLMMSRSWFSKLVNRILS